MVDVVMPTTDGRVVTLPRYVEPQKDVAILMDRLGLALSAQPPPKISNNLADTAKSEVCKVVLKILANQIGLADATAAIDSHKLSLSSLQRGFVAAFRGAARVTLALGRGERGDGS